jgi:membrane protein YdbS with pleckstrin-like domain
VRRFRWFVLMWLSYGVVMLCLRYLTAESGLITPGGTPNWGVLALGLSALHLRILVLFVSPAFLTYRALLFVLTKDRMPRPGP